ncbi:MAG: transcription termination factor NusA, partial [Anaerolineaceae bacterium]|nr:transcription termination factor NusA [Anaerolineaceae bacterium]
TIRMKNEFVLAFNEVIEEKQLPKEIILEAIEAAMVSAYRKSVNASNAQHIEAKIDPETGKVIIYAEKEVVESVQDIRTEVYLDEAKQYDKEVTMGSIIIVESTPSDFGRVAAQTARQVIQQKIREAERQVQFDFYQKQIGEIVSGIVQAANNQGLTIGLELRAEANLSRKDMIPSERFRIHERVRCLIADVKESPRGPQIILSRTHRDFLRRLLENEVPEIYHGIVEIRSIAREPGQRAKVAVSAMQSGIDPVGACVGIRGVRIQAIVRELHDEKIDVIEWNPDPVAFIAKAISPARVTGVYLSEQSGRAKTATVVVPEDQLSLAIGRDGQNARLAAKLTGWRIDIKSLSEAAADALNKLQMDPTLNEMAEAETETMLLISDSLARKSEGRPLTPEEYSSLANFMDRVEKRIAVQYEPEEEPEDTQVQEIRASIPEEAFQENLLDSGLTEHVSNLLQEAGYITSGDLAVQMKTDPDALFRLQGIGPRAMEAITNHVAALMPPSTPEEIEADEAQSIIEESLQPEPAEQEIILVDEIDESVVSPDQAVTEEPVVEEITEILSEEAEEELEVTEQLVTQEPPQAEIEEPTPAKVEEAEEEGQDFEELFSLKPSIFKPLRYVENGEEPEEELTDEEQKAKKKKKRKHKEVEYDPDKDILVVRKTRKRGEKDWDWDLD